METPPPDTYITVIPQGNATLSEPSVTFQWAGSNRLVTEFSYRCVPKEESWSEWSADTSITLNYLDQGSYVFEVRGRYEPGKEDDIPDQRAFTVDIPGPGMLLSPFMQKAELGQEFAVEILADDVEDVMFAHLVLKFEPGQLEALDAAPGESFQTDPPAFFRTIDNSSGIVDLSISTIGAEPPGINGTGSLAAVRFRPISSGECMIYLSDGSEFRDSSGSHVDVISRVGSVVEIAEPSL